jgi:predicted acylesterase/phospholipase RssA
MDDSFEVRKRVFERKGRQATHQLLFYLGLYYRPITFWRCSTHVRTDRILRDDAASTLVRLKALVAGVGYRNDTAVETGAWLSLRERIEQCNELWPYRGQDGESLSEQESAARLDELRGLCHKFLDDSRPRELIPYISHLLNRLRVRLQRWLGKILISLVALFLLFNLPQVSGLVQQTWWSTLLMICGFTLAAVGPDWLGRWRNRFRGNQYWWDLGGQPFRLGAARPPERGFGRFAGGSRLPSALMKRLLVKMTTYLVALVVVLPVAFIVAKLQQEMIIFTVALILALLLVLYGVGQLLDFWDYFDASPIRLFFMGLLLFALLGINSFKLWLAPTVLWALALGGLIWLASDVRREKIEHGMNLRNSLRNNGRIAVVTTGLLLMAVLVTNIAVTQFGKPWQDSEDGSALMRLKASENAWPKSVPLSPERSRNAPVVVLAASGGGSRAAIYTAHTLSMLHEAAFAKIGCNLQAISSVSGGSLANAVYVTLRRGRPCDAELFNQLRGKNGLLKKVAGDFLQPTILGALRGTVLGVFGDGGGRSEYIERAWRDIGLGVDLADLAREWHDAPEGYPPFPMPLFNSTTLETHRVVISPLESSFYVDPLVSGGARSENLYDRLPERYPDYAAQAEDPTWVYYRDGVYGLEDLLPKFTPDLAQSVRASANFPVGFPLVEVRTTEPLFYSPSKEQRQSGERKAKESVYLSDGGVLSNSGVLSLYHLLRNQHGKLVDRGVLLIVVDASAMQEHEQPLRIKGLFGAIRSQEPIGQSLHRRLFESLKLQYGRRLQIVQIDLVPTEATNVETTWTLSEQRRQSLEEQFTARRAEFAKDLTDAWQVLVGEGTDGPEHYRERPPVD